MLNGIFQQRAGPDEGRFAVWLHETHRGTFDDRETAGKFFHLLVSQSFSDDDGGGAAIAAATFET